MSVELKYLVWTCLASALMWLPYVLNATIRIGITKSMGYENRDATMDPWAIRMKKAHYNAVEGLVIFAPLILVLNSLQISTEATQCAAATYFYARIAHYLIYTFGIPWLRTLSFFAAWVATLTLVCELLK
jgi:uncharacterized MAPEG superfamily protein